MTRECRNAVVEFVSWDVTPYSMVDWYLTAQGFIPETLNLCFLRTFLSQLFLSKTMELEANILTNVCSKDRILRCVVRLNF